MFTVLLAWINAKYSCGYDGLFFVTFIMDIFILEGIKEYFQKEEKE